MVIALAALLIVLFAGLCYALYQRPQRGLLLVAALAPFHGLLQVIPNALQFGPWKESLLALTALATFVTPNRRTRARVSIPWWPAAAIFLGIGVLSCIFVIGVTNAPYPFKITYFFMVAVTFIVWRTPFTRRDRDHLITIMMVMSFVTAVYGIAQQILGAEFLVNELGYRYNMDLRFNGPLLRSISTFSQPFPFGLYMMLCLLVCGAVALSDTKRMRNRLFLLATPVVLAGMGVSLVRAAYLGFIVGLIWLAVHRYRYLFGGLAAASAIGAFSLLFIPPGLPAHVFSGSSLQERNSGWSQIGTLLTTNPFGEGLGATGAAAAKVATSSGVNEKYLDLLQTLNPKLAYQPDNYYIKILLELGPIGLWALLTLLITVLVSTLRASRITTGSDSALALGVSASIVAACVASVVSTYFEIFPLELYFWLLLGAVGSAVGEVNASAETTVTTKKFLDSHAGPPARECA